jgi:hypothetical protein
LGALALLIVNDHWLKGAGVLPGWLTGKLSDGAGMIVAPVLLATLCRAERRASRLACFAATALVFAAIKLSVTLASWWAALLAVFGVPWHMVSDPTDLAGLLALPIGWWVLHAPAAMRSERLALWSERAAAFVGIAACLATSNPAPTRTREWNTTAYVVNASDARVDLRVRWLDGVVDCDAIGENTARALAPAAFDPGLTFAVEVGNAVPLERSDALAAARANVPDALPQQQGCQLALLQADGMPDVIVSWRDDEVPRLTIPEAPAGIVSPGRVEIVGAAGALTAEARGVAAVAFALRTTTPSCEAVGPAFQWSSAPLAGFFRVASIGAHADACLDLRLEPVGDFGGEPVTGLAPADVSMCIPGPAFVFGAGEVIDVQIEETWFQFVDASGRAVVGLRARSGDQLTLPSGDVIGVGAAATLSCEGDRTGCDAFVVPLGDALDVSDAIADQLTIYRGRAEQVLVAPSDCELDRQSLAQRSDYVIVHQAEVTP